MGTSWFWSYLGYQAVSDTVSTDKDDAAGVIAAPAPLTLEQEFKDLVCKPITIKGIEYPIIVEGDGDIPNISLPEYFLKKVKNVTDYSRMTTSLEVKQEEISQYLYEIYEKFIFSRSEIDHDERLRRHHHFVKFINSSKKHLAGYAFDFSEFYTRVNQGLFSGRFDKVVQHVKDNFFTTGDSSPRGLNLAADSRHLIDIYLKLHEPLTYPKFADELRSLICNADGKLNDEKSKAVIKALFNDGLIEDANRKSKGRISQKQAALIVNLLVLCASKGFLVKDDNNKDLWSKYSYIMKLFMPAEKESADSALYNALQFLEQEKTQINRKLLAKKTTLSTLEALMLAGIMAGGWSLLVDMGADSTIEVDIAFCVLGVLVGAYFGHWRSQKRFEDAEASSYRMLAKEHTRSQAGTETDSQAYTFEYIKSCGFYAGGGAFMAFATLYYLHTNLNIFMNDYENLWDLDAALASVLVTVFVGLGFAAAYFNYRLEMARNADDLDKKRSENFIGSLILEPELLDEIEVFDALAPAVEPDYDMPQKPSAYASMAKTARQSIPNQPLTSGGPPAGNR